MRANKERLLTRRSTGLINCTYFVQTLDRAPVPTLEVAHHLMHNLNNQAESQSIGKESLSLLHAGRRKKRCSIPLFVFAQAIWALCILTYREKEPNYDNGCIEQNHPCQHSLL